MKAFIAKHKMRGPDRNFLILAKTKKDALAEFKLIKEREWGYQNKDFMEVEVDEFTVYGMDIVGSNYKPYKDSNTPSYFCFTPRFQVRFKDMGFFDPDRIILAETEPTYKRIIEIFKQQNKEMLQELF